MKYAWLLILYFLLLTLISGCIKQFIPAVSEDQNILVVEGLITDQPGHNTIKLTTSMPLGLPENQRGFLSKISSGVCQTYTLIVKMQ